MTANRTITVYGASGHTGQFVVSELRRRGWTPVLSGRDPAKLRAAVAVGPGELELRPAADDSSTALDHALDGAAAVINCAGPFYWTAAPLIEAALRAGIPYLDVAAEIEAVADTLAHYHDRARDAGIVIVPAMAFYGGLGDLLATAATRGWASADEISIAYGLSNWQPTLGTRASGQVSRRRRQGRRIVYTNGHMEFRTDDAPIVEWQFPAPIGTQKVVAEFTVADSVTIPRHLATPEIRSYMTMTAVNDLTDPDPSSPIAVDEGRRSAQPFLVDVVARIRSHRTSSRRQRPRHLRHQRPPRGRGHRACPRRAGPRNWCPHRRPGRRRRGLPNSLPSASGCAGSSKLPTPGGPTTANSAATPTGEPTTATPPSASPPPSSSSSAASSTTAPDGAQPEHLSAQVLRRSRRPVACRP